MHGREQPGATSASEKAQRMKRRFPVPLGNLSAGVYARECLLGRSLRSIETQRDSLRESPFPATLSAGLLARHHLAAAMSKCQSESVVSVGSLCCGTRPQQRPELSEARLSLCGKAIKDGFEVGRNYVATNQITHACLRKDQLDGAISLVIRTSRIKK